jgi:hypothetical protein
MLFEAPECRYYETRLLWAGAVLPMRQTVFPRLHDSGISTSGRRTERQTLPADTNKFILKVEKASYLEHSMHGYKE